MTLVPVPSSTLTKPHTLWVPKLLTEALMRRGLGAGVATCLSRVGYILKSSFNRPQDRATPLRHYETMQVSRMITEPAGIVLVDDVVTRGATFLGAARRIAEMYPDIKIMAFAAMRTISDVEKFRDIMDPCEGSITLNANGDSWRRP